MSTKPKLKHYTVIFSHPESGCEFTVLADRGRLVKPGNDTMGPGPDVEFTVSKIINKKFNADPDNEDYNPIHGTVAQLHQGSIITLVNGELLLDSGDCTAVSVNYTVEAEWTDFGNMADFVGTLSLEELEKFDPNVTDVFMERCTLGGSDYEHDVDGTVIKIVSARSTPGLMGPEWTYRLEVTVPSLPVELIFTGDPADFAEPPRVPGTQYTATITLTVFGDDRARVESAAQSLAEACEDLMVDMDTADYPHVFALVDCLGDDEQPVRTASQNELVHLEFLIGALGLDEYTGDES